MRNLKINQNAPKNPKITKFLSLGGGVQSSTLLLMAWKGEIEMPDYVIFADTGWESSKTYEYIEWLEETTQISIIKISKGNLLHTATEPRINRRGNISFRRLLPLFVFRPDGKIGRIPTRGCTIEFKRRPIIQLQKKLSGARYGQNWICAEVWLGITTDEAHRLRDSEISWLKYRYPLTELNMSRDDCISWLKKNNFPVPPRSSCVFCPYHNNAHWQELLADPFEKEKIRYAEQRIKAMNPRFSLFKKAKSIAHFESLQSNTESPQEECSGFCFT